MKFIRINNTIINTAIVRNLVLDSMSNGSYYIMVYYSPANTQGTHISLDTKDEKVAKEIFKEVLNDLNREKKD